MNDKLNITSDYIVIKMLFFIIFLLLTIYIFWYGIDLGWFNIFKNQEKLLTIIKELGLIGPIVIILLIAIAIIITPIPSAPVALVSGALYGHTFGTVYVVLGALLGALMAFFISRKLGYDYVNKKLHHRMPQKIIGSQNTLMMIVFVTRLAPFISFDVISYAAGLTQLTYARFILATLMGIVPISFLLAHFGSEARNGEMDNILTAVFLLGFFIVIPIIVKKLMKKSNDGS